VEPEVNEATPNSDAGDDVAEVTGESAQEPAEGAADEPAPEEAAAPETAADEAPVAEAEVPAAEDTAEESARAE
jgi:hypothetical protein